VSGREPVDLVGRAEKSGHGPGVSGPVMDEPAG
jgi:hypothetical protein